MLGGGENSLCQLKSYLSAYRMESVASILMWKKIVGLQVQLHFRLGVFIQRKISSFKCNTKTNSGKIRSIWEFYWILGRKKKFLQCLSHASIKKTKLNKQTKKDRHIQASNFLKKWYRVVHKLKINYSYLKLPEKQYHFMVLAQEIKLPYFSNITYKKKTSRTKT